MPIKAKEAGFRPLWRPLASLGFGKTTAEAIRDAVESTHSQSYATECFRAVDLVLLCGISHVVNIDHFNALLGDAPFVNRGLILRDMATPPDPEKQDWVPGDRGYIDKKREFEGPDAVHMETIGENIIYLGRCFETEYSKFEKNAIFWGVFSPTSGPIKKSLKSWLEKFITGVRRGGEPLPIRTYWWQPL